MKPFFPLTVLAICAAVAFAQIPHVNLLGYVDNTICNGNSALIAKNGTCMATSVVFAHGQGNPINSYELVTHETQWHWQFWSQDDCGASTKSEPEHEFVWYYDHCIDWNPVVIGGINYTAYQAYFLQ